jgi:hypothetical protein
MDEKPKRNETLWGNPPHFPPPPPPRGREFKYFIFKREKQEHILATDVGILAIYIILKNTLLRYKCFYTITKFCMNKKLYIYIFFFVSDLRIRDVNPGSQILILLIPDPGSRIPDLVSKNSNKREG